jgi:hypothetical protein
VEALAALLELGQIALELAAERDYLLKRYVEVQVSLLSWESEEERLAKIAALKATLYAELALAREG